MILDADLHSSAARAYALESTRAIALTSAAGHAYTLYIGWPAGAPPVGGWPVVYMLDGETFGIAREIMRYQLGGGPQPLATPRVLVAIGYPGASRRATDYAPSAMGEPHAFRRFLIDEVCPRIQREFDVNATQQTLMGHSIGGLFVLETLFEQFALPGRGAFKRYVASSPSVWWREGHLPGAAQRFVQACSASQALSPVSQSSITQASHADASLTQASTNQASREPMHGEADSTIGLTLSAAEYDEALSPAEQALPLVERDVLANTRRTRRMVQGNRELAAQLAQVPGLDVDFQVFEAETHRSVWPRAITYAMRAP
ncbi:MAG: alpha/beta hydrolase [Comamonadaceae bacterium]|nr:MAG: alpha/beta hydrolase [Comamonadaceae bacterium]